MTLGVISRHARAAIAGPLPQSFFFRIALLFKHFRVIDVVTTRARNERITEMKTFTIDETNNITVFAAKEEATGANGLAFSSQKELAKLTAEWPAGRFIGIWNGFAGVAGFGADLKPVKKFTDRKAAVARIWQAIQKLDAAEVPVSEATSVPETPAAAEVPTLPPQVPDVAPEAPAATNDASPVENAPAAEQPAKPKRKKAAKPASEPAAPRESKAAQVVAMLQRPEGATITEIMQKMGWQKHTVRGFMAGAMKKAGHHVESFKPEGGERSYRTSSK
jgi:Protein of unknown function (DUF3489)